MAKKRPINADVEPASPAAVPPTAEKAPPEQSRPAQAPPETVPTPRNRALPLALKLIAGTVLLAVVFIVAAILGGQRTDVPEPPASVVVAPSEPAGEGEPAAELGYPEFATNNTTRIGGADPASHAAATALAAFPSAAPSQQPDAVTVVEQADWQSAIAASVLMAAPVESPVLISTKAGVPQATADAIDALDPQGGASTGMARLFAVAGAATPATDHITVIGATGATAAAKIAALREKLTGSPPRHLLLAPSSEPAFAMPAAAWAARSGDPVLFAGRDSLPASTVAALKRHPRTPVYVLGPASAISPEVVRRVAALGPRVRRVFGEDPVTNAIALARYDAGGFGWNVNDPGHGFVIARSDSPLDAPAAAALSGSGTWGPLLLTDSADTLPAALRGYLLDVKPGYTTDPTRAFYNHVWIVGDQEAIDVKQQATIDELAELAKIEAGAP